MLYQQLPPCLGPHGAGTQRMREVGVGGWQGHRKSLLYRGMGLEAPSRANLHLPVSPLAGSATYNIKKFTLGLLDGPVAKTLGS